MIPAFLVAKLGDAGAKVAFYGGIALLILLLFLLAYCSGRHDGKTGEVNGQLKREVQVQNQVGSANENASSQRVTDAVKQEQQKQELSNASQGATSPDDARRRRGCVILRQQGRDTSKLAECGGS
jgi:hypothetical protein